MKIVRTWITGKPQGVYLASVSMEIEANGCRLQIRGMRLISLKGKTRLIMPNQKNKSGEWMDVICPLNQETRDLLEEAAVGAFSKAWPPEGLSELLESV